MLSAIQYLKPPIQQSLRNKRLQEQLDKSKARIAELTAAGGGGGGGAGAGLNTISEEGGGNTTVKDEKRPPREFLLLVMSRSCGNLIVVAAVQIFVDKMSFK